jgi:hypothetical protein
MSEKKNWETGRDRLVGTEKRGVTPSQVSDHKPIPWSGTQPAQKPAGPTPPNKE